MYAEQALFASAQSAHAAGYHLVAASPGLSAADARELAEWSPSHDSLAFGGAWGTSTNFFPLAGGAFGISHSAAAGAEYSGRGGQQVRTQCLVVPPELFARFSNDPCAVLRAASATREWAAAEARGARLAPVPLAGRAPAIDHELVAQLALHPGAHTMAVAVGSALASERLIVVGERSPAVIAGLVSCLHVELRRQFSLTTGLKLSPRRPFRLAAAPTDDLNVRRYSHEHGAEVLVLGSSAAPPVEPGSWASFVERALAESRLSRLSTAVLQPARAAEIGASVR